MEGTQIFQIFSNTPHFCVSCVHLVSAPHSHLTWGVWGAFYKTPHFWGVGKVTHYCGDCGKVTHYCGDRVEADEKCQIYPKICEFISN